MFPDQREIVEKCIGKGKHVNRVEENKSVIELIVTDMELA